MPYAQDSEERPATPLFNYFSDGFVTSLENKRHGLNFDTVQAFAALASRYTDRLDFPGCTKFNIEVWPAFLCRNGGAR
jgi:hypothetical protein